MATTIVMAKARLLEDEARMIGDREKFKLQSDAYLAES
jgi:hypothetical protein